MQLCPTWTPGSDHHVTWWEAFDGAQIRAIEAVSTHPLTALTIDRTGDTLVLGSADKTVQMWGYDAGAVWATERRHCAPVTAVARSPDGATVVSGDERGALLVWKAKMMVAKET